MNPAEVHGKLAGISRRFRHAVDVLRHGKEGVVSSGESTTFANQHEFHVLVTTERFRYLFLYQITRLCKLFALFIRAL